MIVRDNGKLSIVVDNVDCEEIRDRIRALSNLVSAASGIDQKDLSMIMIMISDHLPGDELISRN